MLFFPIYVGNKLILAKLLMQSNTAFVLNLPDILGV
jgi:hypothetical protein